MLGVGQTESSDALTAAGQSVGLTLSPGAAIAANLGTYAVTATQLALAFPQSTTGIAGSVVTFLGIFAWTQVPLAMLEGIVTTILIRHLLARLGGRSTLFLGTSVASD